MRSLCKIYKEVFSLIIPFKANYVKFAIVKVLCLILTVLTPLVYMVYINKVMIAKDIKFLPYVVSAYLCIFIITTILNVFIKVLNNKIFFLLNLKLQNKVLKIFLNLPYATLKTYNAGDIKNRLTNDLFVISKYLTAYSLDIILKIITACSVTAIMFELSWKLTICALLVVPLSFLFSNILSKTSTKLSNEYRTRYAEYENILYNLLSNWRAIKINTVEDKILKQIEDSNNILSKIMLKLQMLSFCNKVFSRFKDFFLTQMCLYFIGGLLILKGMMTIGALIAFMSYFYILFNNIGELSEFNINIKNDQPIIERVLEILRFVLTPKKKLANNDNSIKISNVSYRYGEKQLQILNNISFNIKANEHTIIVGKSGSGKSTLAKLLVGLYLPDSGSIYIGNLDISELSPEAKCKKISLVTQTPHIFNTTIKSNLLLAKPDASELEIINACKQANLYETIINFPLKFETIVGENGIKLSGGQLQRLVIARIILLDPEIIVFDESTSALDGETEQLILTEIKKFTNNKTIISITHRHSVITSANNLIDIENLGKFKHRDMKLQS